MNKTSITILSILLSIAVFSQDKSEENSIAQVYPIAFEKEVRDKNKSGISDLYFSGDVILNVSMKANKAANYYFKSIADDWSTMVQDQITVPYELQISEAEYEIIGSFAISNARFDEYMNNTHSADGYDMFTYVKTTNGWKINHMEVTLAQDRANLPEKETSTYDEKVLNGVIKNIEQGFPNNDLSLIKFMETKDHITVNQFKNDVLLESKKHERTEVTDLLKDNQLNDAKLRLGEPKVVDGHMAYVIGKLGTNDVILTLAHQGNNWLVTSFNINI
jgi:hypothetical protein